MANGGAFPALRRSHRHLTNPCDGQPVIPSVPSHGRDAVSRKAEFAPERM